MAEIVIRPALQEDVEVLWDFLAIAAYEPDAASAKTVPIVADHLAGWQRAGDFGFIAEQEGAAILRFGTANVLFRRTNPEISIAVKAHARGRGLGQKLLQTMLSEAAWRGVRLCLNARHDNPALRLYERWDFGFCRIASLRTASEDGRSEWRPDDPDRLDRHASAAGPLRSGERAAIRFLEFFATDYPHLAHVANGTQPAGSAKSFGEDEWRAGFNAAFARSFRHHPGRD